MAKRKPGTIPGMGVLLTFERVFSQKARPDDLTMYIGRFPLLGFIEMICGLSALVHNDRNKTPFPLQMAFAIEFAKGLPYMKRVIEMLEKEGDLVLIHEEQLAVLIKYGLLHATAQEWPKGEGADALIRAMLCYNSLQGAEFEPKPGDFESFMRFELRAVFNLAEHLSFVIPRYAKFFEWARTPEAKASTNALDLDSDFQRFYGMSYEEWAAAAYGFLTHFRSLVDFKTLQEKKAVLSLSQFYSELKDKSVLEKWLSINSMSIEEAQAEFKKTEGKASYSGMALTPFLRRPLLRLTDDLVCCPHIPYLENGLGAGVFFALLDGYNKHDGKEASDKFTRFFGEFFEQYIVSLIKESHPTPDLVFGERKYKSLEGTEASATDLVIFEGSSAIFIDIGASRFNVIKTLVDLDPDTIQKDMEKLVVANARQLDKSIKAFRDGRLTYPGVDQAKITRIFPVVLTIQPIPRAFEFNRRALALIKAQDLLLSGVEPLEMLTAEDAEGLGPLYKGGVLLSDILARKLSHPHPAAPNNSLKNYLYYFEKDTLLKEVLPKNDPEKVPWLQSMIAVVKRWAAQSNES
jgi:hypothetical protein